MDTITTSDVTIEEHVFIDYLQRQNPEIWKGREIPFREILPFQETDLCLRRAWWNSENGFLFGAWVPHAGYYQEIPALKTHYVLEHWIFQFAYQTALLLSAKYLDWNLPDLLARDKINIANIEMDYYGKAAPVTKLFSQAEFSRMMGKDKAIILFRVSKPKEVDGKVIPETIASGSFLIEVS